MADKKDPPVHLGLDRRRLRELLEGARERGNAEEERLELQRAAAEAGGDVVAVELMPRTRGEA